MKHSFLICATLFLAACNQQPLGGPTASATPSRGYAFAQASCASCHGIKLGSFSSPNPRAPEFSAIVNQQGMTAATLSTWLRDAHNYPSEMQIQLEPSEIDDLVAYMLTLSDPNYRPPS